MSDTRQRKQKSIVWFRRGIQVICFFLLPSLFILIFNSIKAILMFLLHGQGIIQTIMPAIMLFGVVTLVTAVSGRFFCGWMCAFGSMGDVLYRLPRLKNKNTSSLFANFDKKLKWIKYILLLFIVIVIWGLQLIKIPQGVNPWDLFGILASFDLPDVSVLVNGFIPAAILLLAIIIASFFVERFFCRYLCPLGAYLGLISKIRGVNVVKKRDHCGRCIQCTKKCSMGIALNKIDEVTTGECIQCMECVKVCPRSNAHIEVDGKYLNAGVTGVVSCILLCSGYYLGNLYSEQMNYQAITSSPVDVESTVTGMAVNIANGVYTGTGTGFRGGTKVSVTVKDGKIENISIDSYEDDEEFFDRASSIMIQEIEKNQSVDVDAVSGATYSSNGIKEAVADALKLSYTPSTVQDKGHGKGHRH